MFSCAITKTLTRPRWSASSLFSACQMRWHMLLLKHPSTLPRMELDINATLLSNSSLIIVLIAIMRWSNPPRVYIPRPYLALSRLPLTWVEMRDIYKGQGEMQQPRLPPVTAPSNSTLASCWTIIPSTKMLVKFFRMWRSKWRFSYLG